MPKIAFVGTGGTIASIGNGPFDLLDYNASNQRVNARAVLDITGLATVLDNVVPIDFRQIDSTAITQADWAELVDLCWEISEDTSFEGIVIGHGTASLEETAWFLSLILDLRIPVVVTGSMRPLTGVSSDAAANLAQAVLVAGAAYQKGLRGVFVVFNGEIHTPRAVTKAHTLHLNAFKSPWIGPIGTIEGEAVRFIRQDLSEIPPIFSRTLLSKLPRIDIAYSYVGADGCAIKAFVQAGAKGIISAGFAPGQGTPAEMEGFGDAIKAGLVVVQSSRVGGGQVVDSASHKHLGMIAGNDLSPQKARILLALCLARGDTHEEIRRVFQII